MLQDRIINSKDDSSFTCNAENLEICEYLLQNGADPNNPADLLAHAVNISSLEMCMLLLKHGANPDSSFNVQLDAYIDTRMNSEYRHFVTEGRETALHAAYRMNSAKKVNLLLKYGANPDKIWMGETPEEIGKRYNNGGELLGSYNHRILLQPPSVHSPSCDVLETVKNCRKFLRHPETKDIFQSVVNAV